MTISNGKWSTLDDLENWWRHDDVTLLSDFENFKVSNAVDSILELASYWSNPVKDNASW